MPLPTNMNLLLLNPQHGGGGYGTAYNLKHLCNVLVTTSDSKLSSTLLKSNLYNYSYFLPAPLEIWNDQISQEVKEAKEKKYVESLLTICQQHKIDFLISNYDLDLYILSKNKSVFTDRNIFVFVPDYEKFIQLFDKHYVMSLAKKHGFPCPDSFLCHSEEEAETAINHVGFPVVIKKRLCFGSDGVRIAYHLNEAKKIISLFRTQQQSLVIQEYIPGTQERSLNFSIMKNGYVPVAFTLKKRRHLRPSFSTAIEVVENPPEMPVAKAMLNELGAFGNYVLQTKIDARDGKYKLIEINSRVGSNFRIICRFDINMPELLIKSLKGENPPETFTIPIGTHGVSPFEDFLGIFSYFSYRFRYYLSKKKHGHNEPPSFGKLVKSFYHTYKQRPILDVYTANFLKDPRESIWHVLFVLRSLSKQGTTAKLRFIPWGDLL